MIVVVAGLCAWVVLSMPTGVFVGKLMKKMGE